MARVGHWQGNKVCGLTVPQSSGRVAQPAPLTQWPVWAGLLTERNGDVCVSLGEMRVVDESVGSELHVPVAVGDLGCFPEPFGLRIREEEDE